ncbi:phospho-sugar mutase [Tenggerimyces flavus]|uniref:Phospho-sugar mutase n=1 Tax=Tenggerimyces flavus TaxID=1708749 RepID=A0ABV7Y274_9ACTN|nr:phospho-sugar mutase [Tenggerimyces flavus]MBM7790813.1 phosphomannomutase [Tenggerimyces flavus]
MTDLVGAARAWIAEDPDPDTRAELTAVVAATEAGEAAALAELEDRFSGPLEFGTAGLRGAMGAGPNRMNRVVVIRAAAGLAAYLSARGGGKVLVGYDARHNSHTFATDTAAVLAGAGLEPLVLSRSLPTPLLAYGIRQLGCVAGVMVTASHNPPQDNGYKVYLGDGSQIVPPADSDISAEIAAVGPLASVPLGSEWETIDDSLVASYLDRIASTVSAGGPRELRMAYTPLHGVGWTLVREAVARAGFALPEVVAEQVAPDPAFPTVTFPNPEEPGAMDLALALGARIEADLVVANDPDADRCAVAVPVGDGFRMLTGDELGALLASHLLASGAAGTFATTIVSSTLLGKIAAKHGQPYVETLTGFKWIGRVPGLAFGYEEALGYCVDPTAVADKDGVSTLVRVAELAASLRASGRTLLDLLDDLARECGVHATSQLSVRVTDLASIGQTLERLRSSPPSSLGGRTVERIDDLAAPTGPLPPTPGLRFTLEGEARVVVRPSGTEPKLKCYLEVVEPAADDLTAARAAAAEGIAAIRADLEKLVG